MPKSYLESLMGEREKIVLVDRQHIFILIRAIFLEICLFVILMAAGILITVFFQSTLQFFPLLVAVVLCLVPIVGALRDTMIWSNREYIVTNRRVIQINGVFNKDITDSSLDKVNDVKMVQTALGRIFNFGDIEILTASELGANVFKHIGKPIRFKTAMLNAKEELERGGAAGSDSSADIPTQIYRLDQLRQKGIISEEEFQQKKKDLLAKM